MALGYSNGANIAAAMLLLHQTVLSGAILLRAMVPLTTVAPVDLAGKPVLILSGAQDPIVPVENAARLLDLLRVANASVEHRTLPVGHGLSNEDVAVVRRWLQDAVKATSSPTP